MINKFLRLAGYKDKYGKWNKDEIIVDLIVIVAAIIVVTVGVRYA